MAYSLQDENGRCLHRANYVIHRGIRRCIDAGDDKTHCGYQFVADDEWKKKKREALVFEKAGIKHGS